MSTADGFDRDVAGARSLHRDRRALFDADHPDRRARTRRSRLRALDTVEEECCEILGRRIPIVMQDRNGRAARRTLRSFSGGEEGAHETGTYSFWSVLAGPVALFILRAPHGRSIEERLREYAGKTARRAELLQKFSVRLMPSSEDEVDLWLRAHPVDAQFAVSSPGQAAAP